MFFFVNKLRDGDPTGRLPAPAEPLKPRIDHQELAGHSVKGTCGWFSGPYLTEVRAVPVFSVQSQGCRAASKAKRIYANTAQVWIPVLVMRNNLQS